MRQINYPKAIVSYVQHRCRYAASLGRLNLKTSCQRIFQRVIRHIRGQHHCPSSTFFSVSKRSERDDTMAVGFRHWDFSASCDFGLIGRK